MGLRAIIILGICIILMLYSLRKPYIGLFVFALITYIRPERFSYGYLAEFHIPFVFGICILIGWLVNRKGNRNRLKISMTIISLFGLAIIQIISSFFAVYNAELSFNYAQVMLKIAIFCFLMTQLIDSEEKLKYFIMVNLIGGSFIAIWGIQQHFLGNVRLENMAGGQFSESNSCAALWVLLSPIFISMIIIRNTKLKIIGLIMSCVLLSAIVFSQSRAGILGLIAAFGVLFLGFRGKQKVVFLLAVLFLYSVHQLSALDVKDYGKRLESIDEYEALESRWQVWQAGWATFEDYPLTGVGQQNFQYLAKKYYGRLGLPIPIGKRVDIHNTPFLMLVEGGIFSLMFYLTAILFFFIDSIKLKKGVSKDPNFRKQIIFVTALNAGIIGFLTCAMVHSYPYYETFYWFLVVPYIARNLFIKEKKKRKLAKVTVNSTVSI